MERMPIYIDKIKFLEALLNDQALTKIKWSEKEQKYIKEKLEELKKQEEVRKDGKNKPTLRQGENGNGEKRG